MPESLVQVTSGGGPKLHTWQRTIGANNVEDSVTVNGEPVVASYTIAPFANISIATVNAHTLQIMAGASLRVRIRRILITQSVAATASGFTGFAVFRLTSAGTGGTAYTPSPLDTSDAAAGMTAMTLPTVKGTEGACLLVLNTSAIQTFAAGTLPMQPMVDLDFDRLRSKPIIIPAGTANGIAIKGTTAMAGASVNITVWADETSFA